MLISLDYLILKYKLNITGIAHFGAHLGQEVNTYVDNGINNIHLFEPQKVIYDELVNLKKTYSQIKFYNYGLGSENSYQTIFTETKNSGQSSSILNPKLHLEIYPDISFTGKEEIEIKKYEDLNIQNINFLNIDIQGYELEALKGCKKILNKIDYIFIEVNRDYLYENNPLVGEIDTFLSSYDLVRVKTKWVSTSVPFGDAFYIRRRLVSNLSIYISFLKIFLERQKIYFKFISPYRSIKKNIYTLKKKLKIFIKKN